MALERWEVKALCMFGLFASMSIFVLLPIRVSKAVARHGKKGLYILSVLSCFGGGVFFGAYLTHLSPDVRDILVESWLGEAGIIYPLPELFTGLGFFLILFLEKLVLWLQRRSVDKERKQEKVEDNGPGMVCTTFGNGGSEYHLPYQVSVRMTGASFQLDDDDVNDEHTGVARFFSQSNSAVSITDSTAPIITNHGQLEKKEMAHNGGVQLGVENLQRRDSCCKDMAVVQKKQEDAVSVASSGDGAAQARSLIFVIALSLDCIFEGLAMGLKDNVADVISLFVAIISHEFIMSFCIGLELVKYNKTRRVVLAGLLYAFTPVFGAIIGTAITESTTVDNYNTINMVSGILQCLSAGTFIYCAFIGILSEELTHDNGFLKACAVLLGFGLMAAMAAITDTSGGEEELVNATMTTVSIF